MLVFDVNAWNMLENSFTKWTNEPCKIWIFYVDRKIWISYVYELCFAFSFVI